MSWDCCAKYWQNAAVKPATQLWGLCPARILHSRSGRAEHYPTCVVASDPVTGGSSETCPDPSIWPYQATDRRRSQLSVFRAWGFRDTAPWITKGRWSWSRNVVDVACEHGFDRCLCICGLSAQGQEGVEKAISILVVEIKITLKLMGLNSIKELQTKGSECVCQIA